MPVEVDFTTPDWRGLRRGASTVDAFYCGIKYICNNLLDISNREALGYTPATLRSFARTIERLRLRANNSASYDQWWESPIFYSFHTGAIAALRLIILTEFEEKVRSDVSVMMRCLEASVHHEFLCRVEIWEDREVVRQLGVENYRETMGSGRMRCNMCFT